MNDFEEKMCAGGDAAIQEAARFFMRTDPVHQTLRSIAQRLDEFGIAYAVADGMALVAHGYDRTTVDVDVLVTPDGLDAIHQALEGRGYLPPFEGSRNLRDTQTGVRIEFIVTGQFPGDGKPKPVAFPDPDKVAQEIDGVRFVNLPMLIELKLASGMSNPGRLRDLADVQELIRVLKLSEDFAAGLEAFVREKYGELWRGASSDESLPRNEL
ncbi:MAG: hypothetical protein IH986_11450 [Planctomycetes bacterium]|nr:hypothetical protein [Planctomycetota bacterium]